VEVLTQVKPSNELEELVFSAIRKFLDVVGIYRNLVVVFSDGNQVRIDLSDDGIAYLRIGAGLEPSQQVARLIMRELAISVAVDDPELQARWAIPDDYVNKPLSSELSTSLLLRIADMIVAKVDAQLLADTWNEYLPINCGDVRRSMVCSLSIDVPLSLELAGFKELGTSLYGRRRRGDEGRLAEAYDDYRSFVRNNPYFEYAYNYLDLVT